MYKDLTGKTALITGSGKRTGIGFAMAEKFAQSGVNIVITDLSGPAENESGIKLGTSEEMHALAKELNQGYGVETLAVPLDVTQTESISNAANTVLDRFGGLDILVNNAGSAFGAPNTVKDYNEGDWIKTIDVNVHGTFRVSKRFLPTLIDRNGTIINVASRAGKTPLQFGSAYSTAKAAIIMLTKVMALELAESGVRVNAICPAIIMTDLQDYRLEMEAKLFGTTVEERKDELCQKIPQGIVGEPYDVAALTAFLASQESRYMTGQALNVCGGMTMEL